MSQTVSSYDVISCVSRHYLFFYVRCWWYALQQHMTSLSVQWTSCPGLVPRVGTHQEMRTLGCNFNRNQYLSHILCPGSSSVGMSCFVQTTPFGLFLSKINISVVSSRLLISPRAAGSGHHFARILITWGEFFFSYLTITHSKVVAFQVLFTANPVRHAFTLQSSS